MFQKSPDNRTFRTLDALHDYKYTHMTGMLFFRRMNQEVVFQIMFLRKGFLAKIANVGLFACVGNIVIPQSLFF